MAGQKEPAMAKTRQMLIRLDDSEKQGFERAAELAGATLSAWARERLRGAARRELIEAGEQVPFYQRTGD
jgi:uncharacterized protein (DUF1778 family)